MKKKASALLLRLISLSILLIGLDHASLAASVVAHVAFARGACAASVGHDDSTPRLLAAKAEVYEGDTIQTGSDSFVVLAFADDTRITIRPNSSFHVEKFAADGEAKFTLDKGGVRAAPGNNAKTAANMQLQTPLGTVKSQGAEIAARLCEQDCAQENAAASASDKSFAGRVVQQQGKLVAIDGKNNERPLRVTSPVYEGEHLRSDANSFGIVLMRDNGKLTIQPESDIEISAFQYAEAEPEKGKFTLRLLAGGFRTLTGAIGKAQKESVKYITPVATVGIRGTGNDAFIQPPTAGAETSATPPSGGLNDGPPPSGLYTSTWQGATEVCNGAGCVAQGEGQSGFTASADAPTQSVPTSSLPSTMQQGAPRPDKVNVEQKPVAGDTGTAKKAGEASKSAESKNNAASSDKDSKATDSKNSAASDNKTASSGSVSTAASSSSSATASNATGETSTGSSSPAPAPGLHVAVFGGGSATISTASSSNQTIDANQSGFVGGGAGNSVSVNSAPMPFQTADPIPAPDTGVGKIQSNFSPLIDQVPTAGKTGGFTCGGG